MLSSEIPDALKEACARADMEQIQDYLSAADTSEHKKILGEIALEAIETAQNPVLDFCLRAGAEPAFRLGIKAVFKNNLEAYKALLSAGLDINEDCDMYGDALLFSVGRDNLSFATFLLDNGAELQNAVPLSQDGVYLNHNPRFRHYQYGAIALAAIVASPAMLTLLLSRGARIENTLALHFAARSGRIEIMQLLLDAGADINEHPTDSYHNTFICDYELGPPLHYSVDYRKFEAAKYLLDQGADATLRDRAGRSVLERSKKGGEEWPELAQLLEERNIILLNK